MTGQVDGWTDEWMDVNWLIKNKWIKDRLDGWMSELIDRYM